VVWCGGVVPEFSRNVRLAASPKAPDRSGGVSRGFWEGRVFLGEVHAFRHALFSSGETALAIAHRLGLVRPGHGGLHEEFHLDE